MKIKFCFIGMISCLLLYLFACFLKKHHNVWFDQWRRVLKIKWEDPIEQKIPITWNFLCLYIVLFISASTFFHRFLFSMSIRVFHNYRFFYELGMCILCFLLGVLFSNGKKWLHYTINNYFSYLRTFSLICMLLFLTQIYKYCIPQVTLFFSILYCICIINYFQFFQKQKSQMEELEFIFQFLWILSIQFINSFIFIYCLWNL